MFTSKSMMSKVKGWKASYYHNSQRKWLYGELLLYPRYIRFLQDEEKPRKTDFRLFYDEFLELKKDSSSFFYAAVTIRVKDEKYWFSSLIDRGSVFNNIEHFWKERLFASGLDEYGTSPYDVETKASGGKALLTILHNSQDTLSSTARTYHQQGQQIDTACKTMNRLHNNLDVAETIAHSLDSWLNSWHVDTPNVHIDVPDNVEMIEKTEFPVLCAQNMREKQKPGSLIISNQCIEVLDAERTVSTSFTHSQVSEVTVLTPWEIIISQYAFGKTDVTVYITSARMAYILKILELAVGMKMNYSDPPLSSDTDSVTDPSANDGDGLSTDNLATQRPSTSALMKEQSSKTVTEAEAAEMSQVLNDMRSVALGIQTEQDRQLRQLDHLSDSVDKASERIQKDTRKVKKLM